MSVAGTAPLALVPPGPAVPPPEPAAASARTGARVTRVRRVMLGAWVTGFSLIAAGPLLAPITHDLSFVAMVLAGVLLLPVSGLALFGIALYQHDRAAVTSLVAAAVVLVSALALTGPAHRAGIELHVAANQAGLDALAEEIRAASAGAPSTSGGWADGRIPLRFHARLQPLGLHSVGPIDGGLLFSHTGEMGYTLLYADGVAGPPPQCGNVRLRYLGGRWYQYNCRDYAND
jgi:hypothetical protein